MHTHRVVRHALPHYDCSDVSERDGGPPESAQQDPPGVVLDALGGDPGAHTAFIHIFSNQIRYCIIAHRPFVD